MNVMDIKLAREILLAAAVAVASAWTMLSASQHVLLATVEHSVLQP